MGGILIIMAGAILFVVLLVLATVIALAFGYEAFQTPEEQSPHSTLGAR